jgi:hypothetical protein
VVSSRHVCDALHIAIERQCYRCHPAVHFGKNGRHFSNGWQHMSTQGRVADQAFVCHQADKIGAGIDTHQDIFQIGSTQIDLNFSSCFHGSASQVYAVTASAVDSSVELAAACVCNAMVSFEPARPTLNSLK